MNLEGAVVPLLFSGGWKDVADVPQTSITAKPTPTAARRFPEVAMAGSGDPKNR
jgi:hypothetical protein